MKKLIIYFLYFIVLTTIFSACVINPEPIDVILPAHEPKLVITSTSLPPFGTVIFVTRSFDALKAKDSINFSSSELLNQILVSGAIVEIKYNNKMVTMDEIAPGIYGSLDLEFIENAVYQLKVIDPQTSQTITASTVMQAIAKIDKISIIKMDSTVTFSMEWMGQNVNQNYYLTTSSKLALSSILLTNSDKSIVNLFSKPYSVFEPKEAKEGKFIYAPELTNYESGDTLLVTLSNISKEQFQFIAAYKKGGSIFNKLLSEPIRNLPSNIIGGYGFFAINGNDARVLILE